MILTVLSISSLVTTGITSGSIQNAYAADSGFGEYKEPNPSIYPSMVIDTLLPGERSDVTTTIDPDNNKYFVLDVVTNVDFSDDCKEDFSENINLGIGSNLPATKVTDSIYVFSDAVPGTYHCSITMELRYIEGFNKGLSIFKTIQQSIEITVPPFIEVFVEIKPYDDPNSINTTIMELVPATILGSDTFDVLDVDIYTLKLKDTSPVSFHFGDENGDGLLDLISHYRKQETGITCGDIDATLTGNLLNGTAIVGTDSVRQVPCKA